MRWVPVGSAVILSLVFLACSEDPDPGDSEDASLSDARSDASASDAGVSDSGQAQDASVASDTGPADAGLDPVQWGCVGQVEWQPPPQVSGVFLYLSFRHTDPQQPGGVGGPFEGLLVEACDGDQSCPAPVATASTAPDGVATLFMALPDNGFTGFFRLSSTEAAPVFLFLLPPVWGSGHPWAGPWALGPLADLQALAGSGAPTLDPSKGHVLALTADCRYLARPMLPATFTTELSVTVNGRSADIAPDDDYSAFFINVDPGPITVEARHKLTQELVGRAEVFAVAGAVSYLSIGPTPLP